MPRALVVIALVVLCAAVVFEHAHALPHALPAAKHRVLAALRQRVRTRVSRSDPTGLTVGGVVVPNVADGAHLQVALPVGSVPGNVAFGITATQMQGTSVEWQPAGSGNHAWNVGFAPLPGANIAPFNIHIGYGRTVLSFRLNHGAVLTTFSVALTRDPTDVVLCTQLVASMGAALPGARVAHAAAALGDNRAATARRLCTLRPIAEWRHANYLATECDAHALAVDLAAATRGTAASAARAGFEFALEEELVDIVLERHNNAAEELPSTTLASSARAQGANVAPVAYVKLDIDHVKQRLLVGHVLQPATDINCLEVVTGPMPVHVNSLAVHRNVVADVLASVPNDPATIRVGPYNPGWFSAHSLSSALNVRLGNRGGAYANHYAITSSTDMSNSIAARTMPNGNYARNNVQVNYDLPLCAVYQGNWLGLFGAAPAGRVSHEMVTRLRTVAQNYVDNHVATLAQRNALPAQQLCELYGLFTMWMYQVVGRSIVYTNNGVPRLPNGQYDVARMHALHAGGTFKNFYDQMIKSNVYGVVRQLSWPLSAVVHAYWTGISGNLLAAATTIVGLVRAEFVQSANPHVARYGAADAVIAAGPLVGRHFIVAADWVRWLPNFDVNYNGNPLGTNFHQDAPAGDAAPAFRVRANGAMRDEVTVVVEARFVREDLNVAMTALHTNDAGQVLVPANELARIANAQAAYQAGGALNDWIAVC